VHPDLVLALAQCFEREAVLHVDGVLRIDGEDHAIKFLMPLDGQIVLLVLDELGVNERTPLLGDLQVVKQDLSLNLGGLVFLAESAQNASLGQLILIIPGDHLGPEIYLLVFF
jgi:hypothetical protein